LQNNSKKIRKIESKCVTLHIINKHQKTNVMLLTIENKEKAKMLTALTLDGLDKNGVNQLLKFKSTQAILDGIIVGFGGSHIWFADAETGERIAIATEEEI